MGLKSWLLDSISGKTEIGPDITDVEINLTDEEPQLTKEIQKKILGLLMVGKNDKALDFINLCLEKMPDKVFFYEMKSTVLENLGKVDEAFDLLDFAIKRFSEEKFHLLGQKASIWNRLENQTQEIECLNKAIDCFLAEKKAGGNFDSKSDNYFLASTYQRRGDANLKLKNYSIALDDYTQAIEIEPKHSRFYVNRCDVFVFLKDYKKAIAEIDKAIELERAKPYSHSYFYRAKIYSEMGNLDNAITDYSTSISISQNEGFGISGYFERGEIYQKTGKYDLALSDFSSTIASFPNDMDAYRKRAEVYQVLGNNDLAEADLEKADLIEAEVKAGKI